MSTKTLSVQVLDLITTTASLTRPANATAYAVDDAVSDVTGNAHFTFSLAPQPGPIKGEILIARITSSQNGVATALDSELWLFKTNIANVADNANWTVTDAEILTRVAVIPFPVASWRTNANNATCDVYPNIPFVATTLGAGAGVFLYGQLVAQNAYVPSSSEIITVELVIAKY